MSYTPLADLEVHSGYIVAFSAVGWLLGGDGAFIAGGRALSAS